MGFTFWEAFSLETLIFSLGLILSPQLSTTLAVFVAFCGQQIFIGLPIIFYGWMISKEAKKMSKSKIRLSSSTKRIPKIDNIVQLYLENTDEVPIPLIAETTSTR